MESKRSKTGPLSWVSGGQLGFNESIQGAGTLMLKRAVVEILQEGENVTKALKRLRPAPTGAASRRAGGKRARELEENRRAAEKLENELCGRDEEVAQAQAEARRQFDRLTEAASELMDHGFEDIYQQSREEVEASIGECAFPLHIHTNDSMLAISSA
ncbi:hypothetical protein WJX81_004215 [Elliptochloris bilobata]|uniref:Uncharacterized protein n=1 Tax=Elliptochloris bilobata TaxID=381761 RepID=A0AAW1S8E5_9CHLO